MKKVDIYLMVNLLCTAFMVGVILILCIYPLGEVAVIITTSICSTVSITISLVCLIMKFNKSQNENGKIELYKPTDTEPN